MNLLRDQGFGNSEMLTLVPEMVTSNPRNNAPGSVSVIDGSITPNIAVDNIIDYRYEDVSVRGFLNILRGRYLRKV
jgi:glycosylphosphatidylinositol transamidase (GPIT) subunit GPI8